MAEIIKIQDGSTDVLPVGAKSGSDYCKMPDGTMIQWGTATITSGTDRITISYKQFTATPSVLVTSMYSGTYRANNVYTYYAIIVCNEGNVSGNKLIYWQAIGRWK